MQETWVRSLGWEDLLEKEMAIHSSTIAWKIPWTEEPGRLQSMGSQRVGHNWATSLSLCLNKLLCHPCNRNLLKYFNAAYFILWNQEALRVYVLQVSTFALSEMSFCQFLALSWNTMLKRSSNNQHLYQCPGYFQQPSLELAAQRSIFSVLRIAMRIYCFATVCVIWTSSFLTC